LNWQLLILILSCPTAGVWRAYLSAITRSSVRRRRHKGDVGRLESALALAHLNDRQDPLTELIANKIIEVFRNGEHEPTRLCEKALKELGVTRPLYRAGIKDQSSQLT
jgi:hypothetical protein